jgi:hypothetical protein
MGDINGELMKEYDVVGLWNFLYMSHLDVGGGGGGGETLMIERILSYCYFVIEI